MPTARPAKAWSNRARSSRPGGRSRAYLLTVTPSRIVSRYSFTFPSWTAQKPSTTGLCGSWGVSEKAWCLRWTATQARGTIPVVTQRMARNPSATGGRRVRDRWARTRWRYTVVARTEACVTRAAASSVRAKDIAAGYPTY